MVRHQALWLLAVHCFSGASQRPHEELLGEHVLAGVDGQQQAPDPSRRLAATCSQPSQPLLWRLKKGTQTAFLVGSYATPLGERASAPAQVLEVLRCADVAYFEVPCSLSSVSGMGNYMAHCTYYPVSARSDAVALRLPAEDVTALQAAMRNLISMVPAQCSGLAEQLTASMRSLPDSNYRITLLAIYDQAIRALNPNGCSWESKQGTHEDYLRSTFGSTKPIFGLEDVDVQCQAFQGNTIEMDRSLVRQMISKFSNASWIQQTMAKQDAMTQVMNCGNLDRLLTMPGALPVAGEQLRSQRNVVLAKGIEFALSQHPGKTVVAAVNVGALVNRDDAAGLPSLLSQAGFTVDRIGASEEIVCQTSRYSAPGAEQLGHCLTPLGQAQPASCVNFAQTFAAMLGKDEMYGRWKSEESCAECVKSNQKCSCQVEWRNTSAFKTICEGMRVDGVSGQVLEVDLTRNPGSIRTGPANAEKTVLGRQQNCYATSCHLPLKQEEALRSWYKTDSSLDSGIVSLRPPGVAPPSRGTAGALTPYAWPWWVWCLGAVCLVVLVAALVACFLIPKERRKGSWGLSGAYRGVPSRSSAASKSFHEEMMPLHPHPLPPLTHDIEPPSLPSPLPPTAQAMPPLPPTQMAGFDNPLLMQAMHMQQAGGAQNSYAGSMGGGMAGSSASGTRGRGYADPRMYANAPTATAGYGYGGYGFPTPPSGMYTAQAMQAEGTQRLTGGMPYGMGAGH